MDAIHGNKILSVRAEGRIRNLVVLRANHTIALFHAHPFVESFNTKYGTNLKLLSPKVADAALAPGPGRLELPSFAVDASIAYEAPGTKLGKHIVFSVEGAPKVVLDTGSAKGEKDVALVAVGLTSADIAYTFDNKTRTLREIITKHGIEPLLSADFRAIKEIELRIPDDRLIIVPDFPEKDGWYIPHDTTVPQGPVVSNAPGARKFNRLTQNSYVGLMIRSGGRSIGAYAWPSERLGVVVEVPGADTPRYPGTPQRSLIG